MALKQPASKLCFSKVHNLVPELLLTMKTRKRATAACVRSRSPSHYSAHHALPPCCENRALWKAACSAPGSATCNTLVRTITDQRAKQVVTRIQIRAKAVKLCGEALQIESAVSMCGIPILLKRADDGLELRLARLHSAWLRNDCRSLKFRVTNSGTEGTGSRHPR